MKQNLYNLWSVFVTMVNKNSGVSCHLACVMLMAFCVALPMKAQTLIDGIYYRLDREQGTAFVSYKKLTVTRPMDPNVEAIYTYKSDYRGTVNIPSSVSYEGKTYEVIGITTHAFYKCVALYKVTIPWSVRFIGSSAFEGCKDLSDIEIPLSVDNIGSKAFYGCRDADVGIPKVIKNLGTDAFTNSRVRAGVTISNVNYLLNPNTQSAMIIPKEVIVDDNYNVQYNVNEQYKGIIYLGQSISYEENGTSKSYKVNAIGDYAFANCTNVDKFFFHEQTQPDIAPSALEGCKAKDIFLLPSLADYQHFAKLQCERCFVSNADVELVKSLMKADEVLPIKPEISEVTPYLRGVSFKGTATNKYMKLCEALSVEQTDMPDEEGRYFVKNPFFAYSRNDPQGVLVLYDIAGSPEHLECVVVFNLLPIEFITQVEKVTQTTAVVSVSVPEDVTWSIRKLTVEGKEISNGERLEYKNLHPSSLEKFDLSVEYDKEGVWKSMIEEYPCIFYDEFCFMTESLLPSITAHVSPTRIELTGDYVKGDAEVIRTEFVYKDQKFDGDKVTLENLDPDSEYCIAYKVYFKYQDGESYMPKNLEVRTSPLEWTTLPAKATSNTVAVLAAQSNINDDEAQTGFEWRRYDAPELVPSTQSACPVIDGELVGALKNLSSSTYYKYRPYYTSATGNTYYGDWLAFGTADAYVYFDPTVRTYTATDIADDCVRIRGYVISGSDQIVKQGFEYWVVKQGDSGAGVSRAASDVTVVEVSGTSLSTLLTGLSSGTTYAFRVFASTASCTIYGKEVTFVTCGRATGIDCVVDETFAPTVVGCYDLQGRRHATLQKGINIVRYSDGSVRKVLMK